MTWFAVPLTLAVLAAACWSVEAARWWSKREAARRVHRERVCGGVVGRCGVWAW